MKRLTLMFVVLLSTLLQINIGIANTQQPNILVYLSDDHSQADMQLYGNKHIPTPNLNQIAKQGMVFNHAYVASPACAPSRAAMLTGLMPARNGAEENHTYPHQGVHSLITNLKALNYEVVALGKVAHKDKKNFFGFDVTKDIYDIKDLEQSVEAFLTQRKSTKPLALFVGTTNPHVVWPQVTSFSPEKVELPPKFIDTPDTRRHRAMYYQEIKELDHLAGRLNQLKQQFMGDNTIYIHTSDHGSQWPFGKWTLYDYGIKVPFIATWPNRINKGVVTDAMISWIDLLPTLIDIAGGKAEPNIDGKSFKSVLLGLSDTHRAEIYTTTTADLRMNVYPSRAIKTQKWKLIHNIYPEYAFTTHTDLNRKEGAGAYWFEWEEKAQVDETAKAIILDYRSNPEFELYDMENDQWELTNLIDEPAHQEIINSLKLRLKVWMQSQNDLVRVKNKPRLLNKPFSYQYRVKQKKNK